MNWCVKPSYIHTCISFVTIQTSSAINAPSASSWSLFALRSSLSCYETQINAIYWIILFNIYYSYILGDPVAVSGGEGKKIGKEKWKRTRRVLFYVSLPIFFPHPDELPLGLRGCYSCSWTLLPCYQTLKGQTSDTTNHWSDKLSNWTLQTYLWCYFWESTTDMSMIPIQMLLLQNSYLKIK